MIRYCLISLAMFLLNQHLFAQVKPEWESIFKVISEETEKNSKAYATLRDVTEQTGHRLTGSPNGSKAEAFVFDLLQSYGYTPHYQSFETESWSRGKLTVKINKLTYKAVSLAHSPIKANVSASLVDMGNGLEEDYLGHETGVKDKIALVYLGILPGSKAGTRNLHRSEKTALAIKYGAKGIIFINSAPGNILLTGTASVTGKLISIPAVCISNEDGLKLKTSLQSKPAAAQINMTNFSGNIKARNVIATLKGKTNPGEKIIIGGHLDSWDLATGAIDNGIGTFAIIDMARTFKALQLQPERTIEFVLFMGEEQGLLGSKAYVAGAEKDGSLNSIQYMLNFDMTNDPRGYSATVPTDKALFEGIGAFAKQTDTSFANTYSSGFGLHSDHQPFMLQGIPTGGASGRLSPEVLKCYHADCDDMNLVNEAELKNTVRFGAMLLYGIADSKTLQAKRMSDEEIKEQLIKSNLKEPLQLAGEWRWKE
ncbi:MAG: M20/M25/M40 family metallo-hydrolase [Chitinophagaceae bacterium]|nr:M20/M25/M40 family metallo-hydrolase [Chitinophagaceae bacterium]